MSLAPTPVVFLNLWARYVAIPSFRNLLEVAKGAQYRKVLLEVDGMINAHAGRFTEHECKMYLLGYLVGICSHADFGYTGLALEELDARLRSAWGNGDWAFTPPGHRY